MKKGDYIWAKFVCPTCRKRFRSKIDPYLDIIQETDPDSGKDFVAFECHTHCPRCETYIPWRDRK